MGKGYKHGAGGDSSANLIVTCPAGVTVTASMGDKTYTKISNAQGIAAFYALDAGTWTVTITEDGKVATKSIAITTDFGIALTFNVIPEFTYTGEFEIVNDADEPITASTDNWKIRFLTSGTLVITKLKSAENSIDVFCVGGGGGGSSRSGNDGGAGGGGGYTATQNDVEMVVGQSYEIVIGQGGSSNADGTATTAFGFTAKGGKKGSGKTGGAGGSGGGGGGWSSDYQPGSGGSNGSDGSSGRQTNGGPGGAGQGKTTREFGEDSGALYAGGGGGGGGSGNSGYGVHASGGPGGGGDGGGTGYNAKNGHANTGGGGGGGGYGSSTIGSGGSGIVVIRNTRS